MENKGVNENKNANNKVDISYNTWLGKWFVVQTSDDKDKDIEQDIYEVNELLRPPDD